MEQATVSDPLWWEDARPAPLGDAAIEDRYDVLVIGAGYAGLSCALELARAGSHVLALDAEMPGYGGSSRNGGQVTGGWNMIDLTAADRGAMRARVESGLESMRHFETLVDREGLADTYSPVGKFVAAFAPTDLRGLARKADWASRNGYLQAEVVPAAEQRTELGTDFYHGGVRFVPGGLVHPATFLAGLLERVLAAGADVAAPVRVQALSRSGGRWLATTDRGPVRADRVFVATNGYTGGLVGDMQRRVVPVASYILATEPLDPGLARRLIPHGRAVSDTARVLSYFRLSPCGRRMVYGGRARFRPSSPTTASESLYRMMTRRFPELRGVRVSHAWMGNVAFARDRLPHMGEDNGLHWALCCNGSGVAMMTYLGHKAAQRMLGRPNAAVCAFDDSGLKAFPEIPLYRGKPWFVPLIGATYILRDRVSRAFGKLSN